MKFLSFIASAAVLAICAGPAQAGLISSDYVVGSGDNWLTRHSETGLDWLDVSLTRGFSFDQIRSSNWYQQGFRYASRSEVENFFAYAAPTNSATGMSDANTVFSLIKQFGPTTASGGIIATVGMIGTDTQGNDVSLSAPSANYAIQLAALQYFSPQPAGKAGLLTQVASHTQAHPGVGSFLVRSSPADKTNAVPTPASWALMLFGLLLLAVRRKT